MIAEARKSQPTGCRATRRRRGVTLVELTATMAVLMILTSAMGSAMMIAGRGLPDAESPMTVISQSVDVVDQISGDLLYATSVTENTDSTITFTVADLKHGAAGPETFRYAWSGTPCEPLTREYNGSAAAIVIENVHDFHLSYMQKAGSANLGATVETEEVILSSHGVANFPGSYFLTDQTWVGQYFAPNLPADAIAWSVTRVSFMARSNGPTNGITAVQLRPANANEEPAGNVLEEVLMYESVLNSIYLWQETAFTLVTGLAPTDGLCLVLAMNTSDTVLAEIQVEDAGGSGRVATSNGGASWSSDVGKSMLYYVYGKATIPDPDPPPAQMLLAGVNICLQVGANASTHVQTEIQVVNTPEVTGL